MMNPFAFTAPMDTELCILYLYLIIIDGDLYLTGSQGISHSPIGYLEVHVIAHK